MMYEAPCVAVDGGMTVFININFACLGSLLHTAGVVKYSFFHHSATILCQVNYHFLLDIITSWDKISTIFLLLFKYFSASSF